MVYTQKDGATLSVGIMKHKKHMDKLVERKSSMDTLGIKSAKLKDKFLFESCKEKPQSVSRCLE